MSKYFDLYCEGKSLQEIADIMNCSWQNVQQHLEKEGIEPRNREVTDHLGNKFKTKTEMCRHWGVKVNTFDKRKRKKWSLKECLEGRPKRTEKRQVEDHLGNKFINERAMCEYWGVPHSTYRKRLEYGYSKEEALCGWVVDHLGNRYFSEKEMAEKWGVLFSTYQQRKIVYKYSLQECLEGRKKKGYKSEHGGEQYHRK